MRRAESTSKISWEAFTKPSTGVNVHLSLQLHVDGCQYRIGQSFLFKSHHSKWFWNGTANLYEWSRSNLSSILNVKDTSIQTLGSCWIPCPEGYRPPFFLIRNRHWNSFVCSFKWFAGACFGGLGGQLPLPPPPSMILSPPTGKNLTPNFKA